MEVEVDDVDIHNGITVEHFDKAICVRWAFCIFYFFYFCSVPQVGIACTHIFFFFFFAVLLLNPISCSLLSIVISFKGSIGFQKYTFL